MNTDYPNGNLAGCALVSMVGLFILFAALLAAS